MLLIRIAVLAVICSLASEGVQAQTAKPPAKSSDDDVVLPLVGKTLEKEPSGTEVNWVNPATGNEGIILVLATVSTEAERPCRTYRRTRKRPEAPVEIREGVGCRVGPGEWELDESGGAKSKKAAGPTKTARTEPLRCPPISADFMLQVPCARETPFIAFTMPDKARY